MSLQIFAIEFFVDFLTYFLIWFLVIFCISRFWRKINPRKWVTIFLWSIAGLIISGASLIAANPDNLVYLKRPFNMEVKSSGFQFVWEKNAQLDTASIESKDEKDILTIPKEKVHLENGKYHIILRKKLETPEIKPGSGELFLDVIPGEPSWKTTKKLNAPLRALTAFYASMGGSNCGGDYCELTSALGLGKQGSRKQKQLIEMYFPNDKVAKTVLQQDCYLRPSGASTFSDYVYLTITVKGDTVIVDYELYFYDHGEHSRITGPDVYLYQNNAFKMRQRNIW
jgi:hypothetical protein